MVDKQPKTSNISIRLKYSLKVIYELNHIANSIFTTGM